MRSLLPFALVGLLAACTAQPPMDRHPIVGAWRSTLSVSSGALDDLEGLEFMYVFHADGTLTESSNYDAAPPVPPAYGVWRAIASEILDARYEFYTTAPSHAGQARVGDGWLPSGRGVITERITMAPDGRTFTSTIRYELFDVKGKPLEGSGDATGRAVRIDF